VVAESLVLRNRQLLVAAKRYGQVKKNKSRSAKAKGLTTQCDRNKIKKVKTRTHFKKRGDTEKPNE